MHNRRLQQKKMSLASRSTFNHYKMARRFFSSVPGGATGESTVTAHKGLPTEGLTPESSESSSAVYYSPYSHQQQWTRWQKIHYRRRPTTTKFFSNAQGKDNLPIVVFPGAKLPPLPSRARRPKFSILSRTDENTLGGMDYSVTNVVPNNTPKPLLPMWASSLTAPQLSKQRLVVENWVSRDAMGWIDARTTSAFLKWLEEKMRSSPIEAETETSTLGREQHHNDTLLHAQLQDNVTLYLRRAFCRGVFAKRDIDAGEVILTIPLTDTQDNNKGRSHGLSINSETLRRHSRAARERCVPSYTMVHDIVGKHVSSFSRDPHPLFVDQVHAALYLACEKAAGPESEWYPYVQLLGDDLFDDDFIRELHLGVLDPVSHLEYSDLCKQFSHYLRQIHRQWEGAYACYTKRTSNPEEEQDDTLFVSQQSSSIDENNNRLVASEELEATVCEDGTAAAVCLPPPSLDDIVWAFRVVLSRQRILPGLRTHQQHFTDVCTQEAIDARELDVFARAVMKAKWWFFKNVLGVVDDERLRVNDFDPSCIATLVPLLDMISHPPSGKANTCYSVEMLPVSSTSASMVPHVVVRALEDIRELGELTLMYQRCYSVSYTLYRYGFLPLHRREGDDGSSSAAMMRSKGSNPLISNTHTYAINT